MIDFHLKYENISPIFNLKVLFNRNKNHMILARPRNYNLRIATHYILYSVNINLDKLSQNAKAVW